MTQQLATIENQRTPATIPMTCEQIIDRVAQIHQLLTTKSIMKEGVHYGPPNGKKNEDMDEDKKLRPVLLQPGAEKLLMTFRLAADFPERIKTVGEDGSITYEVKCCITDQMTGAFLGSEWGVCSTNEEKYHWKRSYIPEEFAAAKESEKRIKWAKFNGKVEKKQQIRITPADIENTVLAMSCKRAKVRATRAALAASDIFDVNTEDFSEDLKREFFGDEEQPARSTPSQALNSRQNPAPSRAAAPASSAGGHDPALGATVIPFGKHKGSTFTDVPEDYVAWLADKSTSPEMKSAAERYLASSPIVAEHHETVGELLPPATAADGYEIPEVIDPFADQ